MAMLNNPPTPDSPEDDAADIMDPLGLLPTYGGGGDGYGGNSGAYEAWVGQIAQFADPTPKRSLWRWLTLGRFLPDQEAAEIAETGARLAEFQLNSRAGNRQLQINRLLEIRETIVAELQVLGPGESGEAPATVVVDEDGLVMADPVESLRQSYGEYLQQVDDEVLNVRRKMVNARRRGFGQEFSNLHDAILNDEPPVSVESEMPYFMKDVYLANLQSMQGHATDNQQSMISRVPEHASHLGLQALPGNREPARRRRRPADDYDGIE